jgi:hypothetical protein
MSPTFEQFRQNLSMLAKQGRSLLSCEDISPLQVEAYKELVDGVLEDSEMRLEDIDQLAAAKAIEAGKVVETTYSSEAVGDPDELPEDEEEDLAETELTVDEIVDIEELDEESDKDPLVPELDDSGNSAELDAALDADVQDADNTAIEPTQELEETVEKVEHVVQRVETFIAVTEDSGLKTDDIQAMAASNEAFSDIGAVRRFTGPVSRSGSTPLVQAFSALTAITLRNIGKSTL